MLSAAFASTGVLNLLTALESFGAELLGLPVGVNGLLPVIPFTFGATPTTLNTYQPTLVMFSLQNPDGSVVTVGGTQAQVYIDAQQIEVQDDPARLDILDAPGRDYDIINHLGWKSGTVMISPVVAGTYGDTVLQMLHMMNKQNQYPITVTYSSYLTSEKYIMGDLRVRQTTEHPVNYAEYDILLYKYVPTVATWSLLTAPTSTTPTLNNPPAPQCAAHVLTYDPPTWDQTAWVRGSDGNCHAATSGVILALQAFGLSTANVTGDFETFTGPSAQNCINAVVWQQEQVSGTLLVQPTNVGWIFIRADTKWVGTAALTEAGFVIPNYSSYFALLKGGSMLLSC